MASNGEQQPSGPPEYKVYRSRKGLFSRLRSADLSSLRERARRATKRGDGKPDYLVEGGPTCRRCLSNNCQIHRDRLPLRTADAD